MSLRMSFIARTLFTVTFATGIGGAVGCAMLSSEHDTLSEDGDNKQATGTSATITQQPVDTEAAGQCGPSTPPDGAVLWKRDLGFVGTLGHASVATDRAGNAFHARQEIGVAKFGAGGDLLWQRPFGAVVAADRAGNAYVGSSSDGGAASVSKLDPEGNLIWSREIGNGVVQSIAVSAEQTVLVSGPGLGTVKLDARGRVEWTKPFGGHVAFGSTGAALITGSFLGTIDLGGGPIISRGRADAFIVKLSSAGQHRWSHIIGDADLPIERPSGGFVTEASDQLGQGIAEAPNGDVLVTGLAIDSVKLFGDDFATPRSTESGVLPLAYVARLDRSGAVVWKRRESAIREVRGLTSDPQGNVVVSGGLVGNVPPSFSRTWIEKLDPSGVLLWKHEESFGVGLGDAIASDRCGNVFFSVTASSAPGGDVHAFLFKLRP